MINNLQIELKRRKIEQEFYILQKEQTESEFKKHAVIGEIFDINEIINLFEVYIKS